MLVSGHRETPLGTSWLHFQVDLHVPQRPDHRRYHPIQRLAPVLADRSGQLPKPGHDFPEVVQSPFQEDHEAGTKASQGPPPFDAGPHCLYPPANFPHQHFPAAEPGAFLDG
jgi:hypothetical protein